MARKCSPNIAIANEPDWDGSIFVQDNLDPNTIVFDDMDLGCGAPRPTDDPTASLEGYWDRDSETGTLYPKVLSDKVMVGKTAQSYDEEFGVVGKIYSTAGYMMGPGTQLIYASDSTTMGIYVQDRNSVYIRRGHLRGAQANAPMINTLDANSVATPPFTFYTDQDTGMYRHEANGLAFAGAGANLFVLNAAGSIQLPNTPATAASAAVPVLARNATTGLIEQRVLSELHTHANISVLDLLTAPAGSLWYNGALVFDPSNYYTTTQIDADHVILQADIDTRSLNTHNHNLADLAERSYNSLTDQPDISELHNHTNKPTLDRIPDYTTATEGDIMERSGAGIAWVAKSTFSFWQRTDTELSPLTAGDNVIIDGGFLKVNTIDEYAVDAGVAIETNLFKDYKASIGQIGNLDERLNVDYGHLRFNTVTGPQTGSTATLAGAGAGNVDDGTHYYYVKFVTPYGETGYDNNGESNMVTVVDKSVDGKVNLTNIPTAAANTECTARKIYRTVAGSRYQGLLLTTINDNVTTTYQDNTPDSGLGTDRWYRSANSTAGILFMDTIPVFQVSTYITRVGYNALVNMINTADNTAFGSAAGQAMTTGSANTFIGSTAGLAVETGSSNTAVGSATLRGGASTSACTAVGSSAAQLVNTSYVNAFGAHACYNAGIYTNGVGAFAGRYAEGTYGVFFGHYAGHGVNGTSTGNHNVFLGARAGQVFTTTTGSIFIGYQTGNAQTSGNYCTLIGYDLDATAPTTANELRIGAGNAKTLIIGSGAASTEYVGFPYGIKTDTIGEYGAGVGVTIDGGLLKDNIVGSTSAYWAGVYTWSVRLLNTIGTNYSEISTNSSDTMYLNAGNGATYLNTASVKNRSRWYDNSGTVTYFEIDSDGSVTTDATNMTFQDGTTGPHTLSDLLSSVASHTHGNITNAGAIGSTTDLPIITTASGVLTVGSFGTTSATFCEGDDSRLSDARTPLSHAHGNITNVGAIGSTTNLPIITTTAGVLIASSFGTGAYTFCQGNDSRLSDARTPTAHAASHLSTGGDAISLFATASVVSGLVPGSDSAEATYYLNATGAWSVPANTIPVDNILDWNGTAYAPYAAQTTGAFDSGVVNPISAVNRLNFDGEFYAYNLYAVNDATVTGQLGVGEVPISTFAGTFKGASTDDDWSNTIVAYDNRVLAAGTGGGITFGGIYTDIGGYTVGGFIRIEKEDAVTDQYGYDLLIGNRVDNASPTSLIDLKAAGGIEFYFYPYPTARSKKFEVTADGVKATLPQVDQNYAVLSDVDGNLTRTLVSGSPTTDFLRGDGTWATPAGSGAGNPAGSDHHVQFNDAGSFGGNAGFQWVDNAWVNINSGTRDTGERLHVYNATNYTYSQLIRTGSPYAHGLWIKQHGASNSTYAFAIQRNVDTTAQYLFGVVLDGRTFLRGYTTATYALSVQQYHATGHGLQIDMTEYTSGAYYAIQVQESTDTAKFTLTGAGDMWTAGDVGIGGTNTTAKLYAYHNVSGAYVAYFNQAHATGHGIRVDIDAASGTTYTLFKGYRDSTKIAELRSDGDWWAHDFLHDSDKRLKDVYQTVNDGLESVLKLNPVTYRWKDKQDDYIHTGFIAQEVQKVFPELVKEGDDGLLSLSYNKVTAINTAAIQGLNRKVDTIEDKLRKEIVDLKLRVKELENG